MSQYYYSPLSQIPIVGGNRAGLDARTEFEILERSPKGVAVGRAHHCVRLIEQVIR